MNATDLKITAAELFADPANGDLTIKDTSSPIVSEYCMKLGTSVFRSF